MLTVLSLLLKDSFLSELPCSQYLVERLIVVHAYLNTVHNALVFAQDAYVWLSAPQLTDLFAHDPLSSYPMITYMPPVAGNS